MAANRNNWSKKVAGEELGINDAEMSHLNGTGSSSSSAGAVGNGKAWTKLLSPNGKNNTTNDNDGEVSLVGQEQASPSSRVLRSTQSVVFKEKEEEAETNKYGASQEPSSSTAIFPQQHQRQQPPPSASRGKGLSRVTPSPGLLLLLDPDSKHNASFQSPCPTSRRMTSPRSGGSSSNQHTKSIGVLANVPLQLSNKASAAAATTLRVIVTEEPLTFPQILDAMITEGTMRQSSAVHWVADGAAFIVDHHQKEALGELLVKYFAHSNYTSLQRQLNMYGFSKHTSGRYHGAFVHPNFHRDRTGTIDLAPIKRNTPKRSPTSSRRSTSPKQPSVAVQSTSAAGTSAQKTRTRSRRVSVSPSAVDSSVTPKNKHPKKPRARSRTPPPAVRSAVPESAKKPMTTRIRISMNRNGGVAYNQSSTTSIGVHVVDKNKDLKAPPAPKQAQSNPPARLTTDSSTYNNPDLQSVALSLYNNNDAFLDIMDVDLFGNKYNVNSDIQGVEAQQSKHSASGVCATSLVYPETVRQNFAATAAATKNNINNYQPSARPGGFSYPSNATQQTWYQPQNQANHPLNLSLQGQKNNNNVGMMGSNATSTSHPGAKFASRPSAESFAKLIDEITSLSSYPSPMQQQKQQQRGINDPKVSNYLWSFLEGEEQMIKEQYHRANQISPHGTLKMTLHDTEGKEKSPTEVVSPIDASAGRATWGLFDNDESFTTGLFLETMEAPNGICTTTAGHQLEKSNFSPMQTLNVQQRQTLLDQSRLFHHHPGFPQQQQQQQQNYYQQPLPPLGSATAAMTTTTSAAATAAAMAPLMNSGYMGNSAQACPASFFPYQYAQAPAASSGGGSNPNKQSSSCAMPFSTSTSNNVYGNSTTAIHNSKDTKGTVTLGEATTNAHFSIM